MLNMFMKIYTNDQIESCMRKDQLWNPVTYPGCLGARYNSLGAQTLAPKKGFLTFYLKIFLNIHGEECFVIQFKYLENVLQRNLRTGTARECIFRASGGTRFKNFCQP